MKTHDNRALFSKALLKAATCFFLIAGAGMSPVFALQGTAESMKMEITQQTVTVSGVVKDRKGEPIIGANIMEKGTTNGTITDFDGKYRLNVKGSQSVLVISYIGYKTQEFEVKNNRKIDVTLQEDTEVMDEVVVIGYGTQRKGDVTSAVASVKAEDFTVGKIGDAADLIKGKVAGLSIAKGSGDPNATSTIRLRGVISVNGSTTPLILIDGVEGDLSTVAPENIASIDVLKDASAAAIYGTRGANGVILITTQNGKRESHTTASYSGYVSASQFGKKLEFMTAEDIRAGKTNFTDKGYDTDWLDAVSRTGFTHNHNFNITGGSKQTTYSADVTYRKEDGVIMNTYSEDIRMRFDVSHWMLNDMLKVNLNMVKKWHKNSATNATATDQSNIYRQAIMRNPTAPIYNEDGSYNEDFNVNYYYNPVGMLEERLGNYTYEETRATGNVTFEPVKGWQTNLMVATSRFNAHDKGYNTTDYFSNQLNEWTGYAYHTQDETRTDNLELTSKYDLNVGKHRMNALVGYNYLLHRAPVDHQRVPSRVIMQTESYPRDAFANWSLVNGHDYIIGDFVWTAIDYLGESGIGRFYYAGESEGEHYQRNHYPWHGAYCGDIDLTGWRKPISHYRDLLYNPDKKLYLAVKEPDNYYGKVKETLWSVWPTWESWNWPGHEGKEIEVEIYSRYPKVRLYLNDKLIGEKFTGKEQQFKAVFPVSYEPGILKAVGVESEIEIEKTILQTAGKPVKIQLTADRTKIKANGQDLSFITVEILDKEGILEPNADNQLTFEVKGAGTIVAVGNADLKDTDSYIGYQRKAWKGRAIVVVKSTRKEGKIMLKVTSPGLVPATVSIRTSK